MGGGNAQKSKTARERNLEKAKAGAKGSQLESNKKAMSIQCKVCMQEFMCTTSEVKCREHAEAKHPKSDVYYGTICACPKSEEPIDPQTLTNGQIGDRFIPASMRCSVCMSFAGSILLNINRLK
ncbi:hypothetical protein F383_02340 [Gossypium arboreum]|uniref:Uncharacterized protein n=1 Tax=Gossypium arboreum TaxID=29729 RepID=A0A0B0PD40_GOSAR|nr:hypothetical protein F383_02340 [Gossypium arboreum]